MYWIVMNYQEALNYLDSFINYEKKVDYPYSKEIFGLKRVSLLLEKLGSPQHGLKAIHITGSKGKGSVACFCASILKEAGFKTGLYTSPHLETLRERIRINGEFIAEDEIIELVEELKPSIEEINSPSFFEIYTAMAFLYFKKKKVDFAVLEVGLGGRLDATNVINPLVSVITPISFEHTKKLGNTLAAIAGEKSGIIKDNIKVISAVQREEAWEVIAKRAEEKNASLYTCGKDFSYRKIKSSREKQVFDVAGIFEEYKELEIKLLGEHQLMNASVAVAAVEALEFYDVKISGQDIKKGLVRAYWPGRVEVVAENPVIILDGAQNVASSEALVKTVRENFSWRRLILILGISKDKDIEGIIKVLEEIADEIIITRANLPRAAEPEVLASFLSKDKKTEITRSIKDALEKARERSSESDLILICGSLFVVGEARQILGLKYAAAG
ncbi:MAG: folylpolyglutamate synthase/dihydrofolate synthase family protein [Candidatus Omnitrophota bacterium]